MILGKIAAIAGTTVLLSLGLAACGGSTDNGTSAHPPADTSSISYDSWEAGQEAGQEAWSQLNGHGDALNGCNAYLAQNPVSSKLLTGQPIDHTAWMNGCQNGWNGVASYATDGGE